MAKQYFYFNMFNQKKKSIRKIIKLLKSQGKGL